MSAAFDVLSNPARRALYDRHGLTAVRERSPGAAPPPTPWRVVKQQPRETAGRGRARRRWPRPTAGVFCLGIVGGIAITLYVLHQPAASQLAPGVPTRLVPSQPVQRQVLCETTPRGQGYIYSGPATTPAVCNNGARPRVLR